MIPMRNLRLLVLAALVLSGAALAPVAEAQTRTQPLCAPPPGESPEAWCAYDFQYLVMGRILDVNGNPATGATLRVVLDQPGAVDASGGKPSQQGSANCKGDFEFSFAGLRQVSGSGEARVIVRGEDGADDVEKTQQLDSFWRRNDVVVNLPYEWPYECGETSNPAWNVQLSVRGRILNRTDAYEVGGVTYHARPYAQSIIGLNYVNAQGEAFCAPDGRGGCQPIPTDELGNFKYTWTFGEPIEPNGHVEVLMDGKSYNATVDAASRLAIAHIETSGRGPHYEASATPAPALALLLVALGVAARLGSRRPKA